jgi:Holliday junction DNA helicase RuvA
MTEREQSLFGFATDAERDLFRLLIRQVSGVGPKVALAVLSGLPVEAFKQAVVAQDVKQLSRIKGIGAKTAERLVFELRDKVGIAEAWQVQQQVAAGNAAGGNAVETDAMLALLALGYKQADAVKAVQQARRDDAGSGDLTANELLRVALRRLGS